MTAVTPDAWHEVFLFSIQIKGGSEIQYAGITENITGLEFGDKDIEGVPMANGGRTTKWVPQPDESVTLKMWPTDAKLTGAGVVQLFHPQSTADSTDPICVENTRLRNLHQIIFTWAENIADLATAGTATTANKAAYRITAKNAYMTSYKPSNDDHNLSAEITFKWPPFAKDGTSNKKEESTITTAIPVATSFT